MREDGTRVREKEQNKYFNLPNSVRNRIHYYVVKIKNKFGLACRSNLRFTLFEKSFKRSKKIWNRRSLKLSAIEEPKN